MLLYVAACLNVPGLVTLTIGLYSGISMTVTWSVVCGEYPDPRSVSPWKRRFRTDHTTTTPVRDEWRIWSSFPASHKSLEN